MDAKRMQYEFGMQVNQFSEALELDSDDIEYWLNRSQLHLIKTKYEGLTPTRTGFEQNQPRTDELQFLIKRERLLPTNFVISSEDDLFQKEIAELPEDYFYFVSSRAEITYKFPKIEYNIVNGKRRALGNQKVRKVVPRFVHSHMINQLTNDPFNKPRTLTPLFTLGSNRITIYSNESFIVDNIFIDYIRIPRKINIKNNIGSEFPESMQEEIIERAVDLFLNNTRELKQRLQRETPIADEQLIDE